MQLNMLGCGDAYDSENTNASMLVTQDNFTLLIDCGPTVPQAFFAEVLAGSTDKNIDETGANKPCMNEDTIDAIYLTHAHPDHCLGLTTLVNWMNAKGRTKPLAIIGQETQWPVFKSLLQFASWPQTSLNFECEWVDSLTITDIGPWSAQTSPTLHAVSNLSLYLTNDRHAFFYSGDGRLTSEGEALAVQADIAFLECEYLLSHESHGAWQDICQLPFSTETHCFLYHIDPQCRAELKRQCESKPNTSVAHDGLRLSLASASMSTKTLHNPEAQTNVA
ncbi:MBL fold metallo-hydrolase [Photobacterium makurazakiensis]|uniref:MBL fold metallo-hydrolase n=1 Tax=Photobacterium makurazakiensis TaxID=2910234 RepID=UPI003D0CFF51